MSDFSEHEAQPEGRNTPRRQRAVKDQADALYMRAYQRQVNDEVRESADYQECLQEAERAIPLELTPFRDADVLHGGYEFKKEYSYRALDGAELYFKRRYEHASVRGDKKFKQGRKNLSSPTGIAANAGSVKVPYRWPELAAADLSQSVYWTEGEKDADTLVALGLVATTAADQISNVIASAMKDRALVVLVDNDSSGEKKAEKAVKQFRHYAKSLRVVRLPNLQHREDVTDWFERHGGTVEKLEQIVEAEPCVIAEAQRSALRALPFALQPHAEIARREWLYKPGYIRGNVSVTAGAGARGKSTMIVAEALAMASGKPLLGVQPPAPFNVWYVNFEDDADELRRRFNAAATHYEMTPADIGERLLVDSGRIVIAAQDEKRRVQLDETALTKIRRTIKEKSVDVAIFDPFVSMHMVAENDNGAIDLVAKALARIAQDLKCAIMLVHHTRKPNGDAAGVDDARGASALANAARYMRVLNPMTAEEAQRFNLDPDKRGFYFSAVDGKTNLTPPAESREWFKLENVELGNGGGFETDGDNVGVVTRFEVAASQQVDRLRTLGEADIRAIFRVGGPWRFDPQARTKWAGDHLALALDIDLTANKAALNRAIRDAVSKGRLLKYRDRAAPGNTPADRKQVDWVKLPDSAPPSEGGAAEMGGAE